MKYPILAAAALCALAGGSCQELILGPERAMLVPPSVQPTRFATVLDSLRYALDLPALAAAIVTDDSIVEAAAVGSRRYGGPANVTSADQFHLGSCTKAFTATLMAVLVDEGRVSWATTLGEAFPELASSMRPEYRTVTLRELLSHSAGLLRDTRPTFDRGTMPERRAALAAWALAQPPIGPRGTLAYSNVGYIIAGAIADRVAAAPFEERMVAKVLRPLGITSAGFGPMGTPGLADEPLQHTTNHAVVEPTADADVDPIYDPSGRLHMSIGDWARFARWRLAAEAGHQTLLRDETARALTDSIVPYPGSADSYAMGWVVADRAWAGGRSLQHNGSNILNYASAVLAPVARWGMVVATNQGPGEAENPANPVLGRLIQFRQSGR